MDETFRMRGERVGDLHTPGAAPLDNLDLATVIKVSQAVSGEIVLETLIDTLMRTAIEQAGAERGLLILVQGEESRIEAEAATRGGEIVVQLGHRPVTADLVPQSILRRVLHSGENLILDDAALRASFAGDAYVQERKVRSVLCLPLINQGKPSGVLYFENSAVGAFAPRRSAVLGLIASQAAIALENARLYRDLQQREAKIQRLVDANIIGIFIWSAGVVIEANDTFLRMLGFGRTDLAAGGIRWKDQTPSEWHDRQSRAEEELAQTGKSEPFEKEYFRKDGTRIAVLVGSALFEGYGSRRTGVSFVLDLSERKRAEAEARDSERRYRELQAEMAHANRLATIGQLTGSIAHEVSQPITATVTNAQAALRWLDRQPPNLEEVRRALAQIARDGQRAGEVVSRSRDLIKKSPSRRDLLEINGPIREVVEFTRSEAIKNSVAVRAELAEGLPLVRGDRVQLQQVMLNLIVNAIEAMSSLADGVRELRISTGKTDAGDVLVVVRDSGPGLAPEFRERIFEAFYTTKPGGLGMGLSICRSIIEAHSGRLQVASNDPLGATFQFTLPAPGEAAPATSH